MTARIDLIDDDPALRDFVGDYLAGVGFSVRRFESVAGFRDTAAQDLPDVVISDLLMPEETGLSLLEWLRRFSQVPVIMLTSQDAPADRVVGLELGADDYVAKPCDPRELLARVRSQLRRSRSLKSDGAAVSTPAESSSGPLRWRFGRGIVLDERAMELHVEGQRAELARKPMELLMLFLRHAGEVMSKEQLLASVWAGRIVSETALTNAVGKLRNALGDEDQEIVRAVHGYGYRFEARPERQPA